MSTPVEMLLHFFAAMHVEHLHFVIFCTRLSTRRNPYRRNRPLGLHLNRLAEALNRLGVVVVVESVLAFGVPIVCGHELLIPDEG